MKKFLAMAALMLSSVGAFAQHSVGTVTIQPKVGLNCSSLTGDGYDYKAGFVGGAELEYQASSMLGISGGVLYSMQGANVKNTDSKVKMDYVNIPILANVYVAPGLAIKAGVQPAFNVNNEYKVEKGGASVSTEFDANSFDFSIPVGISYEYQNVVLDARYNFGLTKIADNWDSKNTVFQLTIGYKFAL